jgi:hypothetical protein
MCVSYAVSCAFASCALDKHLRYNAPVLLATRGRGQRGSVGPAESQSLIEHNLSPLQGNLIVAPYHLAKIIQVFGLPMTKHSSY